MIPQPMDFNPETALHYARALSRPRLVGAGEEERVADEISAMLRRFGYGVERQPFAFSNFVNIAITIELGLSLGLIALGLWNDRLAPWAAVALLAILILFPPLNRFAEAASVSARQKPGLFEKPGFWRKRTTANIIANRAATHPNPSAGLPHLYLVAHYDSKSQRLPIIIRVILFAVFITFSLAFAICSLLSPLTPSLHWPVLFIGLLAVIAGVPLLLFATEAGNKSAGAIDNASGTGLVLHLAECLAYRDDIRLTILITSAEEWAVLGAAAYVKANDRKLRRESEAGKLHILNFDGIGVEGALHYTAAHTRQPSRLLDLVHEACAELKLPLRKFSLAGALFDHIPFAQHGFDAISLITIGKATLAVHTAGDTADKLQVRGFEQAGRVALRVVEKLANAN